MKRIKIVLVSIFTLIIVTVYGQNKTLWLDELDMNKVESGWIMSKSKTSTDGNTFTIAGQKFERGIGTHAISRFMLYLNKKGVRFTAQVGVDDESKGGSVQFYLLGDRKIIWESGLMKSDDPAKTIDVKLKGIKKLAFLVTDGNDGIAHDHADWCNAKLEYKGKDCPEFVSQKLSQSANYILTPKPAKTPRINGAKITGASNGKPFQYLIAASGLRPMSFTAENLPQGLSLDTTTGIISGKVVNDGEYDVKITAKNDKGTDTRNLRIVIGKDKLCLTPPMGWNSWNCWGLSVSEEKVKASADAMIASGLIDHGWTYVNIDDGWEGSKRKRNGDITTNEKFPDMKCLVDYIHSKGLKMGIYSSPGEHTCGGYLGSFGYEEQDARIYAQWGIDYLKYDWCTYWDKVDPKPELSAIKKPYIIMKKALEKQNRDIVHSLCQCGLGNVWEWGKEVGQLWRTTDDITDTWESMYSNGFSQYHNTQYAKPGNWNDPDMLVVGKVGWNSTMHDSRLTADEQYTHLSLWCLLSAPLLIGADMSQMDEFTINLLTNDEVIGINQDPLGKQARRLSKDNDIEIWVKDLEDGSKAVGLFYIAESKKAENSFVWEKNPVKSTAKIKVTWSDLGISGKHIVRDLWRQKDLGKYAGKFEIEVPYHGVVLLKITKASSSD
ncbi:MAG: NPCBM/NEW2 domain-containing protein [Bacteroidota bacterium]|nr:NPCBM/NEW2 domain-containing protein [Bacteroidota bacterium]